MNVIEEARAGASETSEQGWDSEGGVPISEELWLRALRLKESLLVNAETEAHVAPCGDGSIHVYVNIPKEGRVRVEIHPSGCRWFLGY